MIGVIKDWNPSAVRTLVEQMILRIRAHDRMRQNSKLPLNDIPSIEYIYPFTRSPEGFTALASACSSREYEQALLVRANDFTCLAAGRDPAVTVEPVELLHPAVGPFLEVISIMAKRCQALEGLDEIWLTFAENALILLEAAAVSVESRTLMKQHSAHQDMVDGLGRLNQESRAIESIARVRSLESKFAASSHGVYGYLLNKRLTCPHPKASAYTVKPLPDDELAKLTYPTSEDMGKAAGLATGKAYVVLGGSGFVGRYIIRTLLARGETLVRNIDIIPPDLSGDPSAVDHVSHAEFIKADVTNYEAIKDAISRPFGDTGVTAQVIIHTVGVIRPWERLPYLKQFSHKVNVGGTENALKTSQELGTVRAFVFTSSAGTFLPPARYLRLTRKYGIVFSEDVPKGMPLSHAHYPETKREADALVRAADNVKGIRTGVLRPGMAITGPGDLWYLRNPDPNVVWGGRLSQTILNPWDLGRAHVQLADALETRPEGVAGEGFAITGQPTACSQDDMRRVIQFYCPRDLRFQQAPVEAALTIRFYTLYGLSKLTGTKISYFPQWALTGNLSKLQPAMWDFGFSDCIIDDSKARKVFG
ncbi:hypothetical protein FRC07_011181 [Ceratobasidium sp. 392]|nr:hypothetical protein FRC07_011181 [Ceratobasidium sp. 392]